MAQFRLPNVSAEQAAKFEQASLQAKVESAEETTAAIAQQQAKKLLMTPAEKLKLQRKEEILYSRPGGSLTPVGRVENGRIIYNEDTPRTNTTQTEKNKSKVDRPEKPRPNPLDSYANYTYGLSLHALRVEKFNEVVVKGKPYYTNDDSVLIASGGRRTENFKRNPYFTTDFYIENLKMTTIIGHNSRSRGTNAIELSFVIIEPLSLSLVERLLNVAESYNVPNWDQMIFMLQIDYFANTDQGDQANPVPNQSKYIPIKIIDMEIKASTKGAEYRVNAIPAGHMALLESSATTPVIFEVLAETIGEFFSSKGADVFSGYNFDGGRSIDSNRNDEGRRSAPEFEVGVGIPRVNRLPNNATTSASQNRTPTVTIYSFQDALNSYQKLLTEKKYQSYADEYRFVVDKEIADCKIIHSNKANPTSNLGLTNKKNDNNNLDTSKELTRINAGTTIVDVINQIIRNSSYFTNIIKEAQASTRKEILEDPTQVYKVLSEVEFKEWDKKRNKYQKIITFYVKTFDYYNTKSNFAKKSVPKTWVKEYNYMYTGTNQSVIDFSIDFNTMFLTSVTAFANKKAGALVNQENEDTIEIEQTGGQTRQLQVNRQQPRIALTDVSSTSTSVLNEEVVAANDFYKSMMTSSRGDMINVDLKIHGDPEFIKQDSVFYSPALASTSITVGSDTGSLNMDASEIFCNLIFRTPEDINQSTGLYEFGPKNKNVFSGIYKIIQVTSMFERGQFTQNLELIRLFNQESDSINTRRIDAETVPESQGSLTQRDLFAQANEAPMALPKDPAEETPELNVGRSRQPTATGQPRFTPVLAPNALRDAYRNGTTRPAVSIDFDALLPTQTLSELPPSA